MIVALLFVTTVCCAFSLPVTRPTGDVRVLGKRNWKLDPVNSFDEDSVLEEPLDLGNKFEGFTWRDLFSPQRLWSPPQSNADASVEDKDDMPADVTLESTPTDEDIVLHLNADKDLMRFLQWTTSHLGPLHSNNASESSSNNPGLSTWIKLNLSGRRELPLYVEEPKYIVDDLTPQLKVTHLKPYIPRRGRKSIPNDEALKQYNDQFMPNRGKKQTAEDVLKEIFKYDDVIFPHRGKKFDDSTGELKTAVTSDYRSYNQLFGIPPFEDCFTRCTDIPSAPVMMVTVDHAANINELVPATTLLLPQVSSSSTLDAATDGHREAAACGGGAAAVAECQKQNDVKINGFDQSVKAQRHQQQQQPLPSMGVAVSPLQLQQQQQQRQKQQQQIRQRRLSSTQVSASVETSESSFLPFIWSDQVHRVIQQPPHPIRSGQWRDYYF